MSRFQKHEDLDKLIQKIESPRLRLHPKRGTLFAVENDHESFTLEYSEGNKSILFTCPASFMEGVMESMCPMCFGYFAFDFNLDSKEIITLVCIRCGLHYWIIDETLHIVGS
jgi:hypothetical protein